MGLEAPRITIYSRILNNINNEQIEGYADIRDNTVLNFGEINGISGGESAHVIEFDIWNNEPAFSGGMLPDRVADAINCKFTCWDDDTCRSIKNIVDRDGKSFVYARSVSSSYNSEFKPIAGIEKIQRNELVGSIYLDKTGVLSGQPGGDHFKIQTKIIIPEDTLPAMKKLSFSFEYDFI